MRYHGLGSDFSARSDLIDPDHTHSHDDDGGDQFPAMEVKALSDRQGTGNGLMLGLCVAFIGLAVDNLIRTWANQRKKLLGLD